MKETEGKMFAPTSIKKQKASEEHASSASDRCGGCPGNGHGPGSQKD